MKNDKKIIAFPGMVDRLLQQAESCVHNAQHEEAVELLEQAFQYEEPHYTSLTMYVYCLYELKRYVQMKEACEQLLVQQPPHYFEVMELYLTSLMQLKEFKQVERLIESMKQERLIPADQLERFNRLQMLNSNAAEKKEQQQVVEQAVNKDKWFEANTFVRLSKDEQLLIMQQLTERNIRPILEDLIVIVEHPDIHPFIQSLILILLVEQEVSAQIEVTKFNETIEINTNSLPLPTALPKYKAVIEQLYEHFEQEPSTLELIQFLLSKHAIVMYPFDYLHFEVEDLVKGYIDYVHKMFGTELEVVSDLQQFIESLEKLSELQ